MVEQIAIDIAGRIRYDVKNNICIPNPNISHIRRLPWNPYRQIVCQALRQVQTVHAV